MIIDTKVNATLLFAISVMSVVFVYGCSYNAKLQDTASANNRIVGSKSPLTITLIDNRDELVNPSYWHGVLTLNYDVKDAMFSGVKGVLSANYARVDVAKLPITENPLYAVASYEFRTSGLNPNMAKNDIQSGLVTVAKIDLYDTKTKALLSTTTATQQTTYSDPASLNVLRVITYGTVGVATPITLPMVNNILGDYGLTLLSGIMVLLS